MHCFEIDNSRDPILITKLNPVTVTPECFQEYLDHLTWQLDRGKPFVDLHIISESKFVPSTYRVMLGKFFKKEHQRIKEFKKGLVIVNSSVVMSTVLEGVFLVQPPVVPYTVATDVNSALRWIEERFPTLFRNAALPK